MEEHHVDTMLNLVPQFGGLEIHDETVEAAEGFDPLPRVSAIEEWDRDSIEQRPMPLQPCQKFLPVCPPGLDDPMYLLEHCFF